MEKLRSRVLLVDDDARVLEGLALQLRREFDVTTAVGGRRGLETLRDSEFAVVVSDMKMPGMSGAEFLRIVFEKWPDTTRMLLTGYSDIDSALAAVNEGHVFRFLSKPCPAPLLVHALHSAVRQYHLITAERVLLNQTLRGTVRLLADVLAMTHPLAFSRATAIMRRLSLLLGPSAPEEVWKAEMACLFCYLGAINLPLPLLEKWQRGELGELDREELARIRRLPGAATALLSHIPRLEDVQSILDSLGSSFDGTGLPALQGESIPIASRALRIALDFETRLACGATPDVAWQLLESRAGVYDLALLHKLKGVSHEATDASRAAEVAASDIRAGMVFVEDVRLRNGILFVARGVEVTALLEARFRQFAPGTVREPLRVSVKTDIAA